MSLRIVEHKKNPLMGRDEIKAVVEHHGKPTPTRDQILPPLVDVLKADAGHILIRKIFTETGKAESLVRAFVYEKKEDMPRQRMEIIQKRSGKAKAGEAKEEGTTPEAKKEAKAEGKEKHEAKEEKKEAHKKAE